MSILAGIDKLVDSWLNIEPKGQSPHYQHRAAAKELTHRDEPITGTLAFLEASHAQIHANWLAAIDAGYTNPSKENWRWKRHLNLGTNNSSPELMLERAIVNACGDNWSNQMPTASGLTGPTTDRRAAVDLISREDPTTYSLVELKVNSDTPLFAAVEIVKYGLLFVWSKVNQDVLGYEQKLQPILAANTITLSVLAPADYYSNFDLTNMASVLDSGLVEFGEQHGVSLRFEFCQLGADYAPELEVDSVRSAIVDRCRIWGGK